MRAARPPGRSRWSSISTSASAARPARWPARCSGPSEPGDGAAVVVHRQHAARSRHAARLGDDGRRLRRDGKLELGSDAHARGDRRRLELQLRRGASRRQAVARVHLQPSANGSNRPGARTGTRTRAPASSRTPTSSTCRASAITARGRPASRPARTTRSTSAARTASCCATRRPAAAHAACIAAPVRTRRSTSTTCATSASTASAASRASSTAWRRRACASAPGALAFVGFLDDDERADPQARRRVARWRCRCTRSSAPSPTSSTCRRCRRTAARRRQLDRRRAGHRIPPELSRVALRAARARRARRLRRELENVRAGGRSELLDTLIAYEWPLAARARSRASRRKSAQTESGANGSNTEAR